jgi:hypothetical protein
MMDIRSIIEQLEYWQTVYDRAADNETRAKAVVGVDRCAVELQNKAWQINNLKEV